jgi:hypothetical protein
MVMKLAVRNCDRMKNTSLFKAGVVAATSWSGDHAEISLQSFLITSGGGNLCIRKYRIEKTSIAVIRCIDTLILTGRKQAEQDICSK